MKVQFTDAFFNDPQNKPFLAAIERGRAYTAREPQNDGVNYDYEVEVDGSFWVQSWHGFINWHDIVPAINDEVTILGE